GFAADVITETLEKLKEERFLNDDSVAEAYVDSLIRYKTFGYYGIMAKLKQKGINFDLAEKIVSDKLSTEEEEKIAKKLMDKNKSSGLKAAESLKRKGFRSQVIARVTKSS
ncbi:MAG TPA: regulatory protein RecX, partial [Verrucomicrobiae bacterium]|nr:regulatory protein RecX [Verrucomicrobiae bacterium]